MKMARIHPNTARVMNTCSSERDTFTIWMKSLVLNGNGCTIFNSNGDVSFRVDNYQKKCCRKVFLMDSIGRILFSLHREKLGIFGCWEGFKWINSSIKMERPWFKVRRNHTNFFSKDICCQVTFGCGKNTTSCYKIIGLEGKSTFQITDSSGRILAEATKKVSSDGVPLGDDVLTLMVEADVDQSLIMALVTVYGLIINKL